MRKMSKKSSQYPFLNLIISSWKSRAKKSKINLKKVATDAGITPQHLTKIITGKIANVRMKTINDVEIVILQAESKRG